MPKLKTRKTAAKRFKVTKSGKLLHRKSRTSHLRAKQSSAKKRRKSGTTTIAKANAKTVRKMIGR